MVRLEPKVMQVLVCLAEHPGDVVPRETLIARVWPDVFVTDDVLHRAVRELRRVFGDEASAPTCIETIRKRGYRLIAPVAPVAPATPVAPVALAAPASTGTVALSHPGTVAPAWPFTVIATSLAALCAAIIFAMTSRPATVDTEAHPRFIALTAGGNNEFDPALAPDGRRVVFAQREANDYARQADLFVSSQPGRAPERVTSNSGDERMPAWSPDGRQLAFLRVTDDVCDVMIRAMATGDERRVMECPNRDEAHFAWGRDGLVFSLGDTPHALQGWRIATLSLASGERRILTTPPPGTPGDHSPVVSPDGERVAFIRSASGGVADIFVVPIAGGDARRVTFDESDLEGIAWIDGGRGLVFSSDRAGGYTLWRVRADGGTPQFVAGGAARMKHPVASRDGQRIAYENWQYEINVWAAPTFARGDSRASSGGASPPVTSPRPITRTSDLWNYYPQVSPDGARVAYVSTQSGSQEVWIAKSDGSEPRQLTSFERSLRASSSRGAAVRMPRWSPDGRRIAVVAHSGTASDIFIVDVASGSIDAVTSDADLEVAPAWSADGARLYAGVRRDGRWDVWSFTVPAHDLNAPDVPRPSLGEGGVAIDGAYAAQASADGAWLYFTYPDRAGLWRRRVSGGPGERVLHNVSTADWANWAVTPRGVYHLVVEPGDVIAVWRSDHDGRNDRRIATLDQLSWPGISVTPAGDEVIYARWDRRQSRIMLLETSR